MYSIAGFRKVKNMAEFTAIANHNLRIKLGAADRDRIDPGRITLNEVLINAFGVSKTKANIGKKFFEHYEKNDVEIRKDSVLAIDLMLTASPDFFGVWHQDGKITPEGREKIDKWKKSELDFVRQQFGLDAVKFAVLHLDETTPHIHLLVSPEETKTVVSKNRFASKTTTKTVLNAKRFNPKFWTDFVDAHAVANEKFGLMRGERVGLAKNITIKEFRRRIKMATNADFTKVIDSLLNEFVDNLSFVSTPKQVREQFNKVFKPALTKLIKSNKALKIAMEKTIEERNLLHKVKEDFERRLVELERKESLYKVKYTEIDRLKRELEQSEKKREFLADELSRLRPVNKVDVGLKISKKPLTRH